MKRAKFYSIIADEVTDAAQLSIILRYVLDGTIKEVFVDFMEIMGDVLVFTLKSMRRDSSTEFKRVFDEARKLGQNLHRHTQNCQPPRTS